MNSFIASLYVFLGIASFSFAQAPFQNLDFETVIGDRLPGEEFPSEGEFPGWGYFSPVEHTGYGPQKILRINSNDAIAGRYSITMFAGLAFDYYNGLLAEPLTVSPASISQTGVVPSDSRSISIQASSPPGIWSLSLGGTEIELAQISSERWAGNFPRSLAGTSPTLSIVMHPELGDALENNGWFTFPRPHFDNISFSSDVVASVLLGDLDQNEVINFQDIPPFIAVLISGAFQTEGDMNEDGDVNFLDIPTFIEALVAAEN